MLSVLCPFPLTMSSVFRSRSALQVDPGAAASDRVLRRSAKNRPKLTGVGRVFRGWLSEVSGLAILASHRQTGDCHRLAPQRLPLVLDLQG
jgi:hypothetical protein